jgi:glutamyl-tRNA reductase
MHLLLVGISHRTARVELRERLDFQGRGLATALSALIAKPAMREAVVLSTCNRAELYTACEDIHQGRAALVDFIAAFHNIERDLVQPHVYDVSDIEVARHLFRVAAGLDSLVVGEPQILGQVKEAHAAAGAVHAAGPVLNRLFHSSFAAGKRVRTETELGSGAVSISFAAVALARKIFGDLKGRNVLVIGAGEMGKLTARHMKSQGVKQVTIVSRTMGMPREPRRRSAAPPRPRGKTSTCWSARRHRHHGDRRGSADLTKAHVESVMRTRRNRPLFIIDIAMPRDVEAAAGEIEQVFLYNIDDLQATVRENLARRASEVSHAEAIVGEEVEKFSSWLRSRGAIPTVVALRQRFEEVRRSELDRLASSLPPESRERLEEITRLIVEKLLLTPTEQLKSLSDGETISTYSDALTRLFALHRQAAEISETGEAEPERPRADRKVEPFARPGKR